MKQKQHSGFIWTLPYSNVNNFIHYFFLVGVLHALGRLSGCRVFRGVLNLWGTLHAWPGTTIVQELLKMQQWTRAISVQHDLHDMAWRTLLECRCAAKVTERRGHVVNTPPSYSGDPGSNLGPETGYPDWGFLYFSSVPPGKFWNSTLKLGNEHFLPTPLQFIIYLSPLHSLLYSRDYKASLKDYKSKEHSFQWKAFCWNSLPDARPKPLSPSVSYGCHLPHK
jgi:hypothetical protein